VRCFLHFRNGADFPTIFRVIIISYIEYNPQEIIYTIANRYCIQLLKKKDS